MKKLALAVLTSGLALGVACAQRFGGWRWGAGGGDTGIVYTEGRVPVNVDTVRTGSRDPFRQHGHAKLDQCSRL